MHSLSGIWLAIFPTETFLCLNSDIKVAWCGTYTAHNGHVEWIRIILDHKLLRIEDTSLAKHIQATNTDFKGVIFFEKKRVYCYSNINTVKICVECTIKAFNLWWALRLIQIKYLCLVRPENSLNSYYASSIPHSLQLTSTLICGMADDRNVDPSSSTFTMPSHMV